MNCQVSISQSKSNLKINFIRSTPSISLLIYQ